jgi:excinuclease UvrABC nuclease subunit
MLPAIALICGLAYIDSLEQQPTINGKVLYKSKWFRPYKDKKTQLPSKYYDKAGVYIIKSKTDGKVKYVGHSTTSLKKTLYRHFQNWNDRQQDRQVYDKNKYLIKIYRTSKAVAPRLEKYLIDKFKPVHNKMKYPSLFEQGEQENPYKNFFQSYTTEELPF